MDSIILKANAKINLGLNIVEKRTDGFHNLETFFYPVNTLSDELIFTKSDTFLFTCDNKLLQQEENNLVLKAHKLLEEYTNKKLNVKIYLEKNIPIGAGLGGGSSDAATTLLGLNKLFNLKLSEFELLDISLKLGSDVPFFIKSKAAIGKSRGEILSYTDIKISEPILIVNPGIHISTKEAFANIIPLPSNFDYDYFLSTKEIDYNYLSSNLTNDFEKYVFEKYPEVKDIKNQMLNSGALFSLMSGTGSTVYGIFKNSQDAGKCFNLLPEKYFKKVV